MRLRHLALLAVILLSGCSLQPAAYDSPTASERSAQQTSTPSLANSTSRLDWRTSTLPTASSDVLSPSLSSDPRECLTIGEKAITISDFKTAYQASSRAIELNPHLAEAYLLRGKSRYLISNDKQQESINDLETALRLNPRLTDGYEYLGMIYDANKKYRQAIELFSEGLKHYPHSSNLLEGRASVYCTIKENEKALNDFSALIKCMPDRAANYIKRAAQLERMGRFKEALNDYSSAISVNKTPDLVTCDSYKKRARLLSKLRRHKEAIADLSKVIAVDDSDDDAVRQRGDEYKLQNQLEKAIADYTSAINLSPQYARSSYESRAAAYEALGKSDLADKDRQSALKLEQTKAEEPVFAPKHN